MEKDGTEVCIARRVKLKLKKEQKMQMKKFADGARYTYNKTVESVNNGAKVNKMQLRNALVTRKNNDFFDDKEWLLETPKVIRQQAVFEACKNYKACFSNLKAKNIKHFTMRFVSKKKKTWTLGIERAVARSADKTLDILPSFIGTVGYFGKLPFDKAPETDCSIHKDARGRYFLNVPVKKEVSKAAFDERPIVALDPGVRKFLTGFRSDNVAFSVGDRFAARLVSVLQHIDGIDSSMSSATPKERQRLRKKKMHLFGKYKDLRDEFHWKVANWLTKEHSLILVPHLQTQQLSQSPRTKGNREMLAVGHYIFLRRLQQKCKERNVGLMIVDEAYTSKTCGSCGSLAKVGSSETFRCTDCDYRADRDINGARNILIKHMRVVSAEPSGSSLSRENVH